MKQIERKQMLQRRYTDEKYAQGAGAPIDENLLFGHTLSTNIIVARFPEYNGKNALICLEDWHSGIAEEEIAKVLSIDVNELKSWELSDLIRERNASKIKTWLPEHDSDNIEYGIYSEHGTPISNGVFDEIASKSYDLSYMSRAEVYLTQFRNTRERYSNPVRHKYYIAYPEGKEFFLNMEHLDWCRGSKEIKTILSETNHGLKFMDGTLVSRKIIRDNVERDKELRSRFNLLYGSNQIRLVA